MTVKNILTKGFVSVASLTRIAAGEDVEIMPSLSNGKEQAKTMIPFSAQGMNLIDALYYLDYAVAVGVLIWCALEIKAGGLGHLQSELKGRHGVQAVIGAVIVLQIGLFVLKYVFNMD